jgi:hypothetical protein
MLLKWWITGNRLLSRQANQTFFWASWATITLFVACLFILYWQSMYFLSGTPTPLQLPLVRLLLGLVGLFGGAGGVILVDAMRHYWRYYDNSSQHAKRFWYWVLVLGLNFGSCLYYFSVYRNKMQRSSVLDNDR